MLQREKEDLVLVANEENDETLASVISDLYVEVEVFGCGDWKLCKAFRVVRLGPTGAGGKS